LARKRRVEEIDDLLSIAAAAIVSITAKGYAMLRLRSRCLQVALIGTAALCGLSARAAAQAVPSAAADKSAQVTFAKHVAVIFQQKCQECHRSGGMAPMSLVDYQDVRPWARSIKARVVAREMPPWFIDKTVGTRKFKNDISLSDAEIDTIVRWVDAGAPLGDARDLPAAKKWSVKPEWQLDAMLGPPDLVVKAPAFTMPAQASDQWPNAIVDLGLKEDRWVRAIETRPSAQGRRILHHAGTHIYQSEDVAVFEAKKALQSGKGSVEAVIEAERNPRGVKVEDNFQFSEWAIGKAGEVYGDNTGGLIRAGARMGFDFHYHAVGEEITDEAEFAMWFYPKGQEPKYRESFIALAPNRNLEIPPNQVTEHHGYYTLPAPAILQNFQPHMHLRGKAFLTEIIYPDGGSSEVLNYVPKFSFNWMVNYIYADDAAPLLPKGAIIHNVMWHDNTAANKSNPDPRQWVGYGARSVDEMAHLNAQLVFITDAEYQRLKDERRKNNKDAR
jgi:mono/diheme cytochrome c family protein